MLDVNDAVEEQTCPVCGGSPVCGKDKLFEPTLRSPKWSISRALDYGCAVAGASVLRTGRSAVCSECRHIVWNQFSRYL